MRPVNAHLILAMRCKVVVASSLRLPTNSHENPGALVHHRKSLNHAGQPAKLPRLHDSERRKGFSVVNGGGVRRIGSRDHGSNLRHPYSFTVCRVLESGTLDLALQILWFLPLPLVARTGVNLRCETCQPI
ncbi:hypothetical protein E2C01_061816 [Portunus trituberculatus]|uniref:Secreted protein n=1 Tax=Portunus trituberculatus TaxID=210409 RepID=A0A5B7HCX2_PORTR|nr:hypothetical protein [Portunus trituberculatus]